MSYAHRLPYAAAKAPWRVYNRGRVYVQSICETYREISRCVFIPSCICVEYFFIRLRVWNWRAAGGFPGDTAAYGVERTGLYSNTDSDPVAHADGYTYFDGNTNTDPIAYADGHALADTVIDTQSATVAYLSAADLDSRDQ
jgi:hypothetical protein